MSLFHKILIVVLLPITIFGVYELRQYSRVTESFELSIRQELRKSSAETRNHLEETLRNTRKIGHALTVSEDLANNLLFAETDQLYMASQPFMDLDVDYIAFINNDGMVISRGHDEFFFGDDFSNPELLRKVTADKSVMSGLFTFDNNLYLATVMSIVLYEEQVVGTLAVGYDFVDRILPEIETQFSLQVSAILGEELIYTAPLVEQEPMDSVLVTFPSSELSDLTLTLFQDNNTERENLKSSQRSSVFLLVSVFVATALYLSYLIKKLVRPIKLLAEDMHHYKNGKRELVPIPSSSGEIGKIIDIYESMKKENISLLEELERKVRDRTEELNKKNDQLQTLSVTDQLTKLYNRTKLDQVLEIEFIRAKNGEHPFGVILLDIDHFKKVNDEYGHLVGDEVLVQFANLLQSCIRKSDFLGRWGGEEFLIVCTDSKAENIYRLAERLRSSVEQFNFAIVSHKTASFGVTVHQPGEGIEKLLKQADDALYLAKSKGRNRVEII